RRPNGPCRRLRANKAERARPERLVKALPGVPPHCHAPTGLDLAGVVLDCLGLLSTKEIVVVARPAPAGSAETVTLTDAEITSERGVTRRSLLGAMGIGAGAAATVILAAAERAPAADESSKNKKTSKKSPKKPKEETDKD